MQAFGVKTSLVVRDVPLRHVDSEVVDLMVENMTKLGLDVRLKSPFDKVTQSDDGLCVHLRDGTTIIAEKVLQATGRPPLTKSMGLEELGIA